MFNVASLYLGSGKKWPRITCFSNILGNCLEFRSEISTRLFIILHMHELHAHYREISLQCSTWSPSNYRTL